MQLSRNVYSCFLSFIDSLRPCCLDLFSHLFEFMKTQYPEKCVVEVNGCLEAKSVKKPAKKWIELVFKFHQALNLNLVKAAPFQSCLLTVPNSTTDSHFVYFASFYLCCALQVYLYLTSLRGRIEQTLSIVYSNSNYGRMLLWQLTDF